MFFSENKIGTVKFNKYWSLSLHSMELLVTY